MPEPDVRAADRGVLAGDHAAGPQPVATLDLLSTLGDRALWVGGNADRARVQHRRCVPGATPDPIAPRSAKQLRGDQSRCWPGCRTRRPWTSRSGVDVLGTVRVCRAPPATTGRRCSSTRRPTAGPRCSGTRPGRRDCGPRPHPHAVRAAGPRPARRQPRQRRHALRPVGGATGRRSAPATRSRCGTPFDTETASARIAAGPGYLDAAAWTAVFVRAPAPAEQAMAVFAPQDGRETGGGAA